ncbi:glycosyltransferase family 10 [Breoghania sp. L-A4]|uniref:glycosyltransferase family 10 domain-containing protein n=1 Tax=Breoghania sp. L-A4 TaxID=2304600 RepID=UPI0013C2C5B1|nr:glycosyltransferase family 10 [Breoghania sp. L-A4]
MRTIGYVTPDNNEAMFALTPEGDGRLGALRFVGADLLHEADWLVVNGDTGVPIPTTIPRSRRLLFLSEPPEVLRLTRGFVEQFGTIVGGVDVPGYSGMQFRSHPAIHWFFSGSITARGWQQTMSYAELRDLPPPGDKQTAISVVLSKKTQTPQHRARLVFVEALQKRFPDRVKVFGSGFERIDQKADAILPYKYHLALENNDIPHFWTEKLADALLGWSLPVHAGCKNVSGYFPPKSFVPLDLQNQNEAMDTVARLLDSDPYDDHLDAIATARRSLIEEHTVFAVARRVIEAIEPGCRYDAPTDGEIIRPDLAFRFWKRVRRYFRPKKKAG